MPTFFHEKLEVYQRALNFAVLCNDIALQLPRYRDDLKRQLWRASTSLPFNIAEGTGGLTTASRIYHFRIARGSAAECSAIFDYITKTNLLPGKQLPYDEAREVAVMLWAQIKPKLK